MLEPQVRTPSEIKAIEDYARAAGSAAEDVVRAGGRAIDENVIQPIREIYLMAQILTCPA
jgi:hypothetical protein